MSRIATAAARIGLSTNVKARFRRRQINAIASWVTLQRKLALLHLCAGATESSDIRLLRNGRTETRQSRIGECSHRGRLRNGAILQHISCHTEGLVFPGIPASSHPLTAVDEFTALRHTIPLSAQIANLLGRSPRYARVTMSFTDVTPEGSDETIP